MVSRLLKKSRFIWISKGLYLIKTEIFICRLTNEEKKVCDMLGLDDTYGDMVIITWKTYLERIKINEDTLEKDFTVVYKHSCAAVIINSVF